MGRWGGEIVRRYLAESHLDVAARRASGAGQLLKGLDLDVLLAKLKENEVATESIRCPAARSHLLQEVNHASQLEDAASQVAPMWVTNLSSGISHKVLSRSSSAGGYDLAHCGWKFGGHRDAGLPADRQPTVYRQVCARCDLALRASLKAAA